MKTTFAMTLCAVSFACSAGDDPRQSLANQLAACSAAFADAAAAGEASRASRLGYAGKNQLQLAMRLADRSVTSATLSTERKALAERRADPAGAAALDASFERRSDECNRLIEHNMAVIDSLRDGR
ncbi:hypothetical protein [Methyloversatilis sp.]|uniref:hypothetical protein n=1 Tax=Methyloversatilis sp. TaxID=2569862 RepID=UPI002734E580|nr:hypothetical protein [Methyloversatilis sp.]MDP2869562.1 hypothetical protein [Methyloversatilis sp.]MDP3456123.1 hypothetical protein [Methyloversatilis sp.]MDP3577376.1 hypothetical protein [Methyloversatilis sp.]